jgi:probable HAF family extracellular repeat protein
MIDLGNLGGVFSSNGGYGINASGQITGLSYLTGSGPFDPAHAVLAAPPYTSLVDLGTLGGTSSSGASINSSGQITGSSQTAGNAARHPFLISAPYTSMVDLGTLGGNIADGFAINDSGQVTGESTTPTTTYHAFLVSPPYSIMIDLGTLGGAYSAGRGINNLGQVVGISYIADGTQHAFLYTTANGMVDLNALLPSGSGWTLNFASAINDSGQITGYGIAPNGEQHAFVLTPQSSAPTPAQMVTNLIALVQAMNLPKKGTSLVDQLQQVETDITTQNGLPCEDLNAFSNQVKAQAGKTITPSQANQLLAAVATIEAALHCGP